VLVPHARFAAASETRLPPSPATERTHKQAQMSQDDSALAQVGVNHYIYCGTAYRIPGETSHAFQPAFTQYQEET
jgi:hypothetical protein